MTPRLTGKSFAEHGRWAYSHGQASIEYLVVLAFSVILLVKPLSSDYVAPVAPAPSCPVTSGAPALKQLACAIKDYHKHYTFAMAIASIPECDFSLAYDKSQTVAQVGTLTGHAGIGFDRCIDWDKPAIPDISYAESMNMDFAGTAKSMVGDLIGDAFNQSISGILHPDMGDLVSNLSPF